MLAWSSGSGVFVGRLVEDRGVVAGHLWGAAGLLRAPEVVYSSLNVIPRFQEMVPPHRPYGSALHAGGTTGDESPRRRLERLPRMTRRRALASRVPGLP